MEKVIWLCKTSFVYSKLSKYIYYMYSDNSEVVVPNSDPQNDSVLLYDEGSGGLRPLEEGT